MITKEQIEEHRKQLPDIQKLYLEASQKSVEFNRVQEELIDQYLVESKLFSKSHWVVEGSNHFSLKLDVKNSFNTIEKELDYLTINDYGTTYLLDGSVSLRKDSGDHENEYRLIFDGAVPMKEFVDKYGLNLSGSKEYFANQVKSINEIIKLLGL